jgi:hypothetical protein
MRFYGLSVELEQMRIDGQPDDARAGGGASMHCAAVFPTSQLVVVG